MARYEDVFILRDKVSKTLIKISQGFQKFDNQIGKTQKLIEKFEQRTANLRKVGENVRNVGTAFTVGVTLPVVAMGGAMVKAAADIEAMQQQLSTMLGSAEAGGKMFEEIKTMAAKTPFETKDLMSATNTMLGFGIAQEKVLPLMSQLGDISGGNAERFQSLALAFSQVSSAGKLQGQDLLQMINAGFNPLEAIAKRTGKSVGYWKEQMSKGKVSVEMVEQAMKDATSEGGRFFGMMDKQSKTALGQWSTFQDNLNMVLAEFGKIILPTAIKALQKLSETLEWINGLSPGMKKFVLIVMAIGAAIGPLLIVAGQLLIMIAGLPAALLKAKIGFALLSKGVVGFGKSLWGLMTNPITWWIVVITAAIIAVIFVIKNWGKIVEWLKGVWQSVTTFITSSIANISKWLDDLIEKLGWIAYIIPGLNTVAISKKISDKVTGKDSKSVSNTTNNNNSNNTTTNITNNNYSAGLNPRNAQYAT